jgi:hypothetical protein
MQIVPGWCNRPKLVITLRLVFNATIYAQSELCVYQIDGNFGADDVGREFSLYQHNQVMFHIQENSEGDMQLTAERTSDLLMDAEQVLDILQDICDKCAPYPDATDAFKCALSWVQGRIK